MTLQQLRVFVAVAERQHLTRAAAALHIAQSAVSASVAALEAQHGIQLFDRVGRGLQLTAAGAAFFIEARAVLERAEQASRVLARCHHNHKALSIPGEARPDVRSWPTACPPSGPDARHATCRKAPDSPMPAFHGSPG